MLGLRLLKLRVVLAVAVLIAVVASNRYTLAVRCFYSASPLFLWLFDPWFFIVVTLIWGVKFVFFQDFAHVLRGDPEARRGAAS